MKQFKYKSRFRDIEVKDDKIIVRYGAKNKEEYVLTESDIRNGKFR